MLQFPITKMIIKKEKDYTFEKCNADRVVHRTATEERSGGLVFQGVSIQAWAPSLLL